jgi:hypothetical protein
VLFSPLSSKYIIAITLCGLVWACSSALYVPSPEMYSDRETLSELHEGRRVYIASCGSCHNLYKPQSFSNEEWAHQVDEMKDEAKINDAQASLILKYLTGYVAP